MKTYAHSKPAVIPAVCHTCLPEYTQSKTYHVARVRLLDDCRDSGHDVQPTECPRCRACARCPEHDVREVKS